MILYSTCKRKLSSVNKWKKSHWRWPLESSVPLLILWLLYPDSNSTARVLFRLHGHRIERFKNPFCMELILFSCRYIYCLSFHPQSSHYFSPCTWNVQSGSFLHPQPILESRAFSWPASPSRRIWPRFPEQRARFSGPLPDRSSGWAEVRPGWRWAAGGWDECKQQRQNWKRWELQ